MIGLVLFCGLVLAVPSPSFQIPDIRLRSVKIPGLDSLLKEDPPLTTSLEDAVAEIPFLDDFEPQRFVSMLELPKHPDGSILIFPGNYEFTNQSYCLKAGVYGPSKGEGYLYGPWKGPKAHIIRALLQRSYFQPNIPQQDIQVLLWAIIARTNLRDMSPPLRATAARLLTPKEIEELSGGAVGFIRDEAKNKAFARLSPALRPIYEAENRLRGVLTAGDAPFAEVERIAVLAGEPPFDPKARKVPRGRWSFHPDGFFIRFFPEGYSRTKVQISMPDEIRLARDQKGRLESLADGGGNSIRIFYDDAASPLTISGDAGIRGYLIRAIQVTDGITGEERRVELKGWTFVGIPGKARAEDKSLYPGAGPRYEAAKICQAEIEKLNQHFKALRKAAGMKNSEGLSADLDDLMDAAHLRMGIQAAFPQPQEGWVGERLLLATTAWQFALGRYAGIYEPSEAEPVDASPLGMGFRVAFQEPQEGSIAERLPSPKMAGPLALSRSAQSHEAHEAWSPFGIRYGDYLTGMGAGRKTKGPRYDPSKGGALPSGSRQRLGQSSRSNDDKGLIYQLGQDGMDLVGGIVDAIGLLGQGLGGFLLDKWGTGIPGWMGEQLIKWNLEKWAEACRELGGDPPRQDFTELATPRAYDFPVAKAGGNCSTARAEAVNQLLQASKDLSGNLEAAVISVDRHGGALRAKNEEWVFNQAAAVMYYKRESGLAMLRAAKAMEKFVEVMREEGVEDRGLTQEETAKYLSLLREKGYGADSLRVAKMLGLSDEQIKEAREKALLKTPADLEPSVFEAFQKAAAGLRTLGEYLAAIGPLPPPQIS